MVWPVTFGTATSPWPMSTLDTMFNQSASMMSIPCSCSGTNAYSLLPLVNCPALTAYSELGGYRFIGSANATAAVTIQYNGLGFLPAYHADGVTQANFGDVIVNEQYVATFHQGLNGGLGGFFLETPASALAASGTGLPGGRLSASAGVPVQFNNVSGPTAIYYSPYRSQFCPIFNGSTIQQYSFSSPFTNTQGLTLNLGGAGGTNFPASACIDVFMFLNNGVPALGAAAWSTSPLGGGTRQYPLTLFGGILTNNIGANLQTGPLTSVTGILQNQATFLGTFYTTATGTYNWNFGGVPTSGGAAAYLLIANYYNPVLHYCSSIDNNTGYTYSNAAWRVAGGVSNTTNLCYFVQCNGERAPFAFLSNNGFQLVATTTSGVYVGLSANVATSANSLAFISGATTVNNTFGIGMCNMSFTTSGVNYIASVERGDGTNANKFNINGSNTVSVLAWL